MSPDLQDQLLFAEEPIVIDVRFGTCKARLCGVLPEIDHSNRCAQASTPPRSPRHHCFNILSLFRFCYFFFKGISCSGSRKRVVHFQHGKGCASSLLWEPYIGYKKLTSAGALSDNHQASHRLQTNSEMHSALARSFLSCQLFINKIVRRL